MLQSYRSVCIVGGIKAAVVLIPLRMKQTILCIMREVRLVDNYAKLQMCGGLPAGCFGLLGTFTVFESDSPLLMPF